ncbi:RNA polymerase, sigma 28 subunit, FliA/WhiG [Thermocrinis albus DSM 14484]|uniref:RNA polymerase, sigma 28 subunit, FliA/WhiG n=1 Tax=Thermocrinis albus (strain DSM 14484 / JCM 11386 / HI 11/12) TaxID=638303 RepID=D3SM00_THEAH|nr:FliA/WhiG family RNA polymerase sigma factor [Thermocrinis albus]ADC89780.1 RNA polymerase, sigma 28 subunit, FliA/WhiG [Thermocrinis albus DSM 14484]
MDNPYVQPVKDEDVLKYLPLVKSVAKKIHRHLPPSVDINDLIGYGILAVMESLSRIDPTKNPSTYLYMRVKGAMYDYLRSLHLCSRRVREREKLIRRKMEELRQQLGRDPTDEEIGEALGETPDKIYEDVQRAAFAQILSLDALFREGRSYEELLAAAEDGPEEKVLREERRRRLLEAIEKLSYREKLVLQLLFYEELPAKTVAKLLGVSSARISQIKEQAIEKLKEELMDTL